MRFPGRRGLGARARLAARGGFGGRGGFAARGGFGGRAGFGGGQGPGGGFGSFRVTPWVKRLLLANAIVFMLSVASGSVVAEALAFRPDRLWTQPWGLVTYMFVHQGLFHLLFNLLFIFFFGPPLESRWGSDVFVKFYVVCGLGGAVLSFAFSGASIIGASAACYGIMLAFAMFWPNAPVWIWGLVPVRVKWLVVFLVALSFASSIGPTRDGVAHLAHLGGAAASFLLVISGVLPKYGTVGTVGGGAGPAGGGGRRPGRGPRAAGRASAKWQWKRRFGGLSATFIRRSGPREASRPRNPVGDKPPGERRPPGRVSSREEAELDRVDAVLDKISAQGIDSLTSEERRLLDRVSRRTGSN